MAQTPEFLYVARKVGSKAEIQRIKASKYKPSKRARKSGSMNAPGLAERLTEAFAKAVAEAKNANAKFKQ